MRSFEMLVDDVLPDSTGRGIRVCGPIKHGTCKTGNEVVILNAGVEVRRAVIADLQVFKKPPGLAVAGDEVVMFLNGLAVSDLEKGWEVAGATPTIAPTGAPGLKESVATPPEMPPPSQAKQGKACPFCGEEILANAIKCKHCGEFLDGRSAAKRDAVKESPKTKVDKVESELWQGNPSYLYYFSHFIFGFLFLFSGLLVMFAGKSVDNTSAFCLGVLGMVLILYAILDRSNRVYTLTSRRVTSSFGIISRSVHEVVIGDIRNLNVKQKIVERLFGLGSIEIASSGTEGVEVTFEGVSDPLRVRDIIRREKDDADSKK